MKTTNIFKSTNNNYLKSILHASYISYKNIYTWHLTITIKPVLHKFELKETMLEVENKLKNTIEKYGSLKEVMICSQKHKKTLHWLFDNQKINYYELKEIIENLETYHNVDIYLNQL
ncbi:hypothetical protein [Aestuariibaculum sediminum]|uniref:Uncharacterized protein n=1 Tax=Aestuariibaculum sediminum TaxID=2770637 RepID=A0A8J6QIG2_9FLAO|nr:hypothetical protein [Aestuariibaculum sediminum]MBD0832599.1 hypothetical protein [Aestuariibaculum sediminum]